MNVLDLLQKIYPNILWTALVTQLICIIILASNRATEAQKYIISALNETLIYIIGCLIYCLGTSPVANSIGMKIRLTSVFFLTVSLYTTFHQVFNEKSHTPSTIIIAIIAIGLNIPVICAQKNGKEIFGTHYNKFNLLDEGTSSSNVFKTIYFSFILLFLLLQLIMFIKASSIARRHKYQIQKSFFFVAAASQILIFLDLVLECYKPGIPVAPVTCIVASIGCCILIRKNKISNLYDISRSEVINSLKDPLFIIDNRFYVRYANNIAKVLFPEYKSLKYDNYHRLKTCPELQNIITPPIHETLVDEGFLKIGKQIYEPELHRMGTGKTLQGYVITLNDVTEQKTKNDFLEQQNLKLSSALRTIKNRNMAEHDKLISGLLQSLGDKNPEMAAHMRRTSNYTFVIARELRRTGYYTDILTDSYMETLGHVAPMHDIGKYMVPQMLLYRDDLTEEEKKSVQAHTILGMQIIDRFFVNNPDDLFYRLSHEVAQFHHEWWNGTGFPKNLIEEEIPLSARIVAVADVFDTLSAKHASRNTYHFDEAFDTITNFSGTRFDPLVVEAFNNAKDKLKELYDQMFQ